MSTSDSVVMEITKFVSDKIKKPFSKSHSDQIYRLVVNGIFNEAISKGSYRFPGGFGSLIVKNLKEGTKTTPAGVKVKVPARKKIRYNQGVTVTQSLVPVAPAGKKAATR